MSYRSSLTLLMLAALVALGFGLYGYFAPMTGVTGVWGPLAASFGALCLFLGAALMTQATARTLRVILMTLLGLALALTLLAAVLLHQWGMVTALAIAGLGWLTALSGPEETRA